MTRTVHLRWGPESATEPSSPILTQTRPCRRTGPLMDARWIDSTIRYRVMLRVILPSRGPRDTLAGSRPAC